MLSGILIWKCINDNNLVGVFPLNTPSTTSFCVYSHWSVVCTFHVFLWPSKHQSYFCSHFKTSKYVSQLFLRFSFLCKYVISVIFRSLGRNCISGTYLVAIDPRKTLLILWFYLFDLFYCLLWGFLTGSRQSKNAIALFP